ncbi:hypothetical protein IWQ61_008414 [Dispira simplex]|nr:hypothetical protein IWQ61_008414 [Dispira simplex]
MSKLLPFPDEFGELPTSARELNVGAHQVACRRSHMNVYQDIVHTDRTHAFVLEDDVDFEVDIENQVRDKLHYLPKDWGLFYLGSCEDNGVL